jgi:hypothetical protein
MRLREGEAVAGGGRYWGAAAALAAVMEKVRRRVPILVGVPCHETHKKTQLNNAG